MSATDTAVRVIDWALLQAAGPPPRGDLLNVEALICPTEELKTALGRLAVEFDAIAARRSGREDGGSRAGNAVVAQILTEMDGFRPDVPLLVIGTTNRLDIIDAALLRPSRFQAITIGLPDTAARRAIAAVHARRFQVDVAPELLDLVADMTGGCNGDEIRSLFRDACVGLYCEHPPLPTDAQRSRNWWRGCDGRRNSGCKAVVCSEG